MHDRIVITGIGVVSPLGIGFPDFRKSLEEGISGIDFTTSYSMGDFPVKFSAEIKNFEPKDFIPRKAIKVMARDIQLACAGAKLAMEDSAIGEASIPQSRIGVSLGAGLINPDIDELGVVANHSTNDGKKIDIKKFGAEGIRELAPLWLLKQLPNMPSSHVSISYNAHGPTNSITTGCSSALLSIGESMDFIKNNAADIMLSGGVDSKVNPLSVLRFYMLGILAHGWENPCEASRPFDKKRNGLVAGEGAGIIMLENFAHARARGAKIYAELIGFGSSFSDIRDFKNNIDGKVRAMKKAVESADIKREDIDIIAAHGLSTPEDDIAERGSICSFFGKESQIPPVMAVKSLTGYPGAASGVTDMIAVLSAMQSGIIPANPNYNERDEGDHLDYVAGTPRKRKINCAMVNAFSMTGHNGVVIIRRQT